MCGINGIYRFDQTPERGRVVAMNNVLAHRGPDANGVFTDQNVVLGHRRLSIIDLSEKANQPMTDAENRFTIVYNGEIYNFAEVKAKLADYPFATNSDSEVVLAAWRRWGVDSLSQFNGMFAMAIWDAQKQELTLARDRMGIKPIYYFQDENGIVFSSELRALLASDVIPRKLNRLALADYLRYQTVHAPETIIDGVKMLEPGHFLKAGVEGITRHAWWVITDQFHPEIKSHSIAEVRKNVKEKLYQSVERRLVADVPFGAFLSGGIDSSAIVGIMNEVGTAKVQSFSVVFDEEEFTEAPWSRMVAQKFGTEHHEMKLRVSDFLETVPEALAAMDFPGGDGPNTYVVSKATREAGITMALSGLGGDELFGGYDIFKRSVALEGRKWLLSFPRFMRRAGGGLLKSMRPGAGSDKIAEVLALQYFDLDHTYPISRQVLMDAVLEKLYQGNLPPNRVHAIANVLTGYGTNGYRFPLLSQVSFNEIYTYMQNVLLRDSDQMSMAVALEVRVPFLDHELVEYVINVSDRNKYPHTAKKLLIDSLGDLLPKEVWDRPKMGFTLPWADWLKQDLRAMAESRINALAERTVIDGGELKAIWQRFLKGDPRYTWSRVWPLVVLEDWLQKNSVEA